VDRARSTTVAIIGAGRAGTTFGVLLERAGHRVVAVSGGPSTEPRAQRHLGQAKFVPAGAAHEAARAAEVVLLSLPDDRISDVCAEVAARQGFRNGQWVLHVSGSLGLEALDPAARQGAETLSLHPLQAFPDVETGVARLPGSAIAVTARTEEGMRFGQWLAHQVGGRPFPLKDEVKPLYHSAAVFCSNYLVAVEGMAERLFRLAGVESPLPQFGPLARAALDAALRSGPGIALTGPAARGDTGTLARNLTALRDHAPEALDAYVVLGRVAAELAEEAGLLSPEDRRRVERELAAWR
jgi:predicted short-subunit dehydrogenase-like oxidoreductase (DUF2520 family)